MLIFTVLFLIVIVGLLMYISPFLPNMKFWPTVVRSVLFPIGRNKNNAQHKKISKALVSVVVPVYNEGAEALKNVLSSLAGAAADASRVEVVVVDGGSKDDTMDALQETAYSSTSNKGNIFNTDELAAVRSTNATGGRGPALVEGASLARGEVLIFCHADTRLPQGYDDIIRTALEEPDVWMTAFSFGIERETGVDRPDFDFVERGANVRSRLLWLPYGDQALALRAATYRAVGGFRAYSMMEDFEFVCRIRARALASGGRVRILRQTARCSARRWDKKGVYKNTFLNWGFVFLYWVGVGPDTIFRLYYGR